MIINENILIAVNIGVLIALFSSLTWVIYKKKYETAISIGLIIVVYIIFKYIIKVF